MLFSLTGDRIAIMANGVLQCCGTSLFLKNKYGVGYHMVMVKSAECDVAKVSSVIKRFIPSAKLENDVGRCNLILKYFEFYST